jgi:hypothetical protein
VFDRWAHCLGRLRSFAVALAVVVCAEPLRAEIQTDWNPQHTFVFAVGLLEWQQPDLWPGFPAAKKNRRDAQLVQFFRQAGVPSARVVYLEDAQATKQQIKARFAQLLDQTSRDDLLIFYFAGHGYRDAETGQTWFANYDAGKKDASAWNVHNIFDTIEKHFHGKRALLMADCCHSGALYDQAFKRRGSPISFAALTSAYSHNSSTGNWTFSDCLLAGFRGQPLVDADSDGIIELHEVARYAELEMAFIEGQKSVFTATEQFPREAKVAPTHGTLKPRVGERIEAYSEDGWYKAKIIDSDGTRSKVHYVNYDASFDEWLTADKIRPYKPHEFTVGTKVQVYSSDGDKWYPAIVRRAWYGLHFIHYDDYDVTWDEWVGPESIRLRKK